MILHADKLRPAVLFLQGQRLRKLGGVHRRGADIACFAGLHHVVERFQGFFDRRVVIPAVNLQDIDIVHAKASQAVVDRTQDLRPG
ncbi:hypothetical protein D3C81_1721230 [compost metagenome]